MAFVAMMRLVHDPREIQWNKRKEKLNSKLPSVPAPKQKPEQRLRCKVAAMRKRKQFPLTPENRTTDKARRFGYIPSSVRKKEISDYAKV